MLAGGAELELRCQEEERGRSRHPRPTILPALLAAPERPVTAATGSQNPSGRLTPARPRDRGQLEARSPARASSRTKA